MNCNECALSKRYAETKGRFALDVYCTVWKRGVSYNGLCDEFIARTKAASVRTVSVTGGCARCGHARILHNMKGMTHKVCDAFIQPTNSVQAEAFAPGTLTRKPRTAME